MAPPFQKCKKDKRSPLYPCEKKRCGHSWTVRYRAPGGRTGSQLEKSFDRWKDASDFNIKVENDKREGVYSDPKLGKVSFIPYAKECIDSPARGEGTKSYQIGFLYNWVKPVCGNRTVASVEKGDLQQIANNMVKEGLAASTIGTHYKSLRSIFNKAVSEGRRRTNPCDGVELPWGASMAVDEDAIPNSSQVSQLASLMREDNKLAVWLMAGLGLRVSEALGFSIESVRGSIVRLRHQLYRYASREDYGKYLVKLKHRKEGEYRDIPLPNRVANQIDQHVDKFGSIEVEGQHLLFSGAASSAAPVLTLAGMTERWKSRVRAVGMDFTPHDLRHYYASQQLAGGANIHEVSRWLGHKSIQVTVDVYGHLTEDAGERGRAIMDAVLPVTC